MCKDPGRRRRARGSARSPVSLSSPPHAFVLKRREHTLLFLGEADMRHATAKVERACHCAAAARLASVDQERLHELREGPRCHGKRGPEGAGVAAPRGGQQSQLSCGAHRAHAASRAAPPPRPQTRRPTSSLPTRGGVFLPGRGAGRWECRPPRPPARSPASWRPRSGPRAESPQPFRIPAFPQHPGLPRTLPGGGRLTGALRHGDHVAAAGRVPRARRASGSARFPCAPSPGLWVAGK